MKTKKYVIALAIFGGMLFTAYAANAINQDGQQSAKVEKAAAKPAPAAKKEPERQLSIDEQIS